MNTWLSKWIGIGFCYVPAVITAAIIASGIVISGASLGASFGGRLALGLLVLALLICLLHMSRTLWHAQRRHNVSRESILMAVKCCLPSKQGAAVEGSSSERLQVLRAQRKALEHEVAALQQQATSRLHSN